MGKSRKNSSSSFKRDKDQDAYYEDSHTHKNTKGSKPSKGHSQDNKSRDRPSAEYIDWDSL